MGAAEGAVHADLHNHHAQAGRQRHCQNPRRPRRHCSTAGLRRASVAIRSHLYALSSTTTHIYFIAKHACFFTNLSNGGVGWGENF